MNRTRTRTAVLAALGLATALSLTACNSGDTGSGGTKDEGAASPSSSASASTGSGTGSGESAGDNAGGSNASPASDSGSGSGSGSGSAKNKGTGTGTAAKSSPECKVTSLRYTLERKNPEQQGDHLLIKAVNTSGAACTVQKFPVVTPGDANGDVPVAKDDVQPAQPLLVPAGGTVYSALPVYQEVKAEDDYFTSLRLSLVMNDSDASSAFVTLKTPGEVEYAGKRADGIEVLSWNPRMPYAN
ncbi:DUF4232 domain-containing protein [Streptomyces sp. NPDC052225]|uniref:DUF4232 domain-containing protein n=1 Tax=Streptomyces sp. NPDC052225 TaxID=3154949 RepID=UPI0034270A09